LITGAEAAPVSAIQATELTRTYDDLTALSGLSLSVDRGEIFGFLGPNGAGKTTAIQVLTGQSRPDAGHAEVLGVDPVADPVGVRERVGILPEQERPPSYLTPREYFSFVGAVRGLDDGAIEDRVETWTNRLSFREKLDTLCGDLSRGQQQKVMLTGAFLHEPEAVFIDEPLANLDPIMQERLKRFLREYRAENNAVFLSTHDIEVAEELCTRVGIINEGELLAQHRPEGLPEGGLLAAFLEHVENEDPGSDVDGLGRDSESDRNESEAQL
jgi:ABC-2 type transport system ATP-binding protein